MIYLCHNSTKYDLFKIQEIINSYELLNRGNILWHTLLSFIYK